MGARTGAAIIDLLFPERCLACGAGEEGLLCRACRAGLLRLEGTLCGRCGAPTAWPVDRCGECAGRRLSFASARAAVAYEGGARTLVAAWKERGLRRLACIAGGIVAEIVAAPPADALTFVPADADRSAWRGVATAEALARDLGSRWELPVASLLGRTGSIPRQRGLSRSERRANVKDAFVSRAPSPRVVALVDDVYTTGATADAAARALRRAGAEAVHVVTLARAVRR